MKINLEVSVFHIIFSSWSGGHGHDFFSTAHCTLEEKTNKSFKSCMVGIMYHECKGKGDVWDLLVQGMVTSNNYSMKNILQEIDRKNVFCPWKL